jgi:hypothetical protein
MEVEESPGPSSSIFSKADQAKESIRSILRDVFGDELDMYGVMSKMNDTNSDLWEFINGAFSECHLITRPCMCWHDCSTLRSSDFVCILTVLSRAETKYGTTIFQECFYVNHTDLAFVENDMNRATLAWVKLATQVAFQIDEIDDKIKEAASSPTTSDVNLESMIDDAIDPNDCNNESTLDDSNSHTGDTTASWSGDVAETRDLAETCSYDEVSQGGSDAHVISAQRE